MIVIISLPYYIIVDGQVFNLAFLNFLFCATSQPLRMIITMETQSIGSCNRQYIKEGAIREKSSKTLQNFRKKHNHHQINVSSFVQLCCTSSLLLYVSDGRQW